MKSAKKNKKSTSGHKPFAKLKDLIDVSALPNSQIVIDARTQSNSSIQNANENENPKEAQKLFEHSMVDVEPLKEKKYRIKKHVPAPLKSETSSNLEVLRQLDLLVSQGHGFIIDQIDEYVEGVGAGIHPRVAKELHTGKFSIQAHLDLHGFIVQDAKELFDSFLKKSITLHQQAVLIIHGRGLTSPKEPILKKKVIQWLTCGPWRKWVMAFASAPMCDGGTGATYILFRKQPITKSQIKKILKDTYK